MKRVVYKFLGIAAIGLFSVMSVSAQPGRVTGTKYGKGQDSVDCIRNLSLYRQDYNHKNYEAAIVFWRKVLKDCPMASPNLAVPHGTTMYQYFISRELDQAKKKALVDTLMQVYDKGMELYPDKAGYYMTLKGQDMEKYSSLFDQGDILKTLEDIMVKEKEKTMPRVYANYIKMVMDLNSAGKLSDEQLFDDYTKVSDYINAAIKKTPTEELAKARDQIDDAFASSAAATCENLIKIYGAKYEANKSDADFLRKLTRMLNRKECTDSELFEKASEQQYALNPSSDAAFNMAKLFLRKENYDKALEYFENAIKSETDPLEKANYNYQVGSIMLAKYSKYTDAKKYALEAIKLRPDWSAPYILLSQTYVAGPRCGEDDFEKAYVYWVAVDKLQKAKAVDPDCAGKVNPLISSYTQHFPKKEEAFFRNITEGANITVGCWIGETTKARFSN